MFIAETPPWLCPKLAAPSKGGIKSSRKLGIKKAMGFKPHRYSK